MRTLIAPCMLAGIVALGGCDYLPFGYTPIKGTVGSVAIIGGSAIGLKVAETKRLR